jgi:3-phenylpropionate/cinnamic acid dioxygenase small subunit
MATKKAATKAVKKAARPAVKKPAAKKAAPARKSAAPLKKAIAGSVVIRAGAKTRKTGAQAIAPDHSPRAAAGAVTAPRALAAVTVRGDLKERVEQFLFRQSELLDNKYWQDYIDLFADDGVYWMPVLPEQTEWEGSPSIFAEDKLLMAVRMGRVTHPNAWSQAPLWMTNHIVGNVVIEKETEKEVQVRSRFHMMELRRDSVRHFGGTYRHTLVKKGKDFRIKLQRVDLFNAQASFDYVLQIWV